MWKENGNDLHVHQRRTKGQLFSLLLKQTNFRLLANQYLPHATLHLKIETNPVLHTVRYERCSQESETMEATAAFTT